MHLSPKILLPLIGLMFNACALTSHEVKTSTLGTPHRSADILAMIDLPGPISVETVTACDWAVDRGGLINLKHPKAIAAKLEDGDEPIQIYFHALRHPQKGLFLIDTGVEKLLRDKPDDAAIQGLVAHFMHVEKMKNFIPLADWLAKQPDKLNGVFLTHMHIDHVSGVPDVPKGTAIYSGPGETTVTEFTNLFMKGNINRELEGQLPIEELPFKPDEDKRFAGLLDIFGDGSLWAIWVPGHTPGSMAFIARTPQGAILFTGDTSHTKWGWDNGVEPGKFTGDQEGNAKSLMQLKGLVAEHPAMEVRLGHQKLR